MGIPKWTNEQKEFLVKHYKNHTMAELAKLINDAFGTNFTRNAISGAVNRLGVASKGASYKRKKPRRLKENIDGINTGPTFNNSRPNQCLYIGEYKGAQSLICGEPVYQGAYCNHHCHIVYEDFSNQTVTK